MQEPATLLDTVAQYYSEKLAQHGQTPRGVDWNGQDSQHNRFQQLSRILPDSGDFSVNDLGCGYGALVDYLAPLRQFTYRGYDVAAAMVESARQAHAGMPGVEFIQAAVPTKEADYGVASGIFNVRLAVPEADWRSYMETTLDALAATSQRGFAFNCLTSYSDAEKMQPTLYYADPCYWFDQCKRRYSRQVALLHDYGLWEFTILVRK